MAVIYVAGGANFDIYASADGPLKKYDSNPGRIRFAPGGVGRNIAAICRLLDTGVSFITCFADDLLGEMLKKNCEKLGMDCTKSRIVQGMSCSTYLAILGEDNDMLTAINDMRVLEQLTPEYLVQAVKECRSDDILVIDANLSKECIQALCDHVHCRIAADPVSSAKALRFADRLSKLDIFKPNRYEAETFTGIPIHDMKSAKQNAEWFMEKGVQEILISMADEGVVLGYAGKCRHFTHRRVTMENATGGGDSFMGAYVSARVKGFSPEEAVQRAVAAAILTIECDAVHQGTFGMKEIEKVMQGAEIKETEL